MEIIAKIVKVGENTLMVTIPKKICSEMKIVKGNYVVLNVIRKVRK